MLAFNILVKRIAFNFARRVKASSPPAALQDTNLSREDQSESNIEQLSEQQQQLMEEFVPLPSAVSAIKQKVKSDIVKELAYEGEDPSPNKLVNRPAKGVVWGLGGQLIMADRKMELQGVRDDPEEIAKFLQLQQVKNIYIHDWKAEEDPALTRRRYSIIGSCYSARHCWNTALELKNALNKHMLQIKRKNNNRIDAITALVTGRKNEEWMMVEYKEFEISLMTEEQREAVDLQWKWNNPVSEDVVEKHSRMDLNKKKRKTQFIDFD